MPGNDIIIKLIQEGDQLLQDGDLDAAEQKYREVLDLNQTSAEALYSIGAVYTRRRDIKTALEWAERAVAADPSFKPAHALVGNVLFGLDKYEDALVALALADKSNLAARAQMGLCCEKLERWEEAEKHYRAVLENDSAYKTRYSMMALYDQNPFSADVHHALARVLQRQNKVLEAKLHYHLTKRIDPTTQLDPMYLEIMTESDLENHLLFDEKELEKPSVGSKPSEKLNYLLSLSDYATLHEDIQEYKSKDFISYVAGMTNVFQQEGNFYLSAQMRVIIDLLNEEKRADLFAALRLPSWKRLLELAEMVHAGKIPMEESLELADRLEFDWKSVNLLLDLSDRFVELEPETGFTLAQLVEQVLIRSPKKSDAGSGAGLLGKAYYRARKLEKAAESFQKASDIFSQANDIDGALVALYWLDIIQTKQGRFTEALSTIDQYIQLAKSQGKTRDVISGRYERAWTLFMADRAAESYDECLMVASMIQEEDVEDEFRENLEKLLVQAAEKAGNSVPNEVLETVRSETVDQGESVDTLLSRAIIAQESGELEKALLLLEKARTIAESEAPLKRRKDVVRVLTDTGALLFEIGRLTEAMDKLREALWVAEPISSEVDMWTILVNLGVLADSQGKKDEAITYLERALQEARQQRSHDREGQCLLRLMQILNDVNPTKAYEYLHEIENNFRDFLPFLKPQEPQDWVEGIAAMEAGQYREGIAALERLCMDKSPDAERLHPEALANRGNAHSYLGEIPEAINCWENAANACSERGDHGLAIDILGRVADLLKQEGKDYSETLTRMFKIWEDKIENIEPQCRVGVELAEKAVNLGEFTRSEIVLEKVLSIVTSDEWRNITDEIQARTTLGKIYRKTSRYREAVEQYQKALACAQYLKDEPAEGVIRGWMGIAYRFLDELGSAVEQYQRAIDIAERYQDAEAAAGHRMNLAASLFLLGRDEEGKNTALEALGGFDATGNEEMALNVLIMLLEHGEWEELPAELQARIEALNIDEIEQSQNPTVLGFLLTKQAQWLASTGNIEGVQTIMEKMIAMYGEIGDRFNQASSFLNMARILKELDTAQAISNATMARDLAISIGQMHLTVECQEFLLTATLRVGDDQQINSYLDSVLDGWIRLRRRLKSDRDRINFVDRTTHITRRCAAHFLQNGQIARAFELQEWGRAQTLTDLLLTESLHTSMQSDKKEVLDLVAQESEILNSMQDQKYAYLDVPPLMEPRVEERRELTRDLGAELSAVYKALETYDPYYVLQKKGVPVNMARVQALLSTFNRPAAIVTLGFVGDEIVAMTLRHDQNVPSVYQTGMGHTQVEAVLDAFNEEIHLKQGTGVRKIWRDKAAPLLHGPAEDIHENDLVVLVPEGDLQQLPLHSLRLPNGQLLVEHAAIVYTPSLTVLEVLQLTEHKKQFSMFLSVGVSFPDEARAVSMRFGNLGSCISGNYLAKDEIRDILSKSSIAHFACHGYFDQQHYLESGLKLSTTEMDPPLRKEILSVRDIMTWRLDSELVILSACETGRGTAAPSELLGLGRGFLAAGAQSVIVALWKISDEATQAFMLTFYENLNRQLKESDIIDVAEALRQTQCQYAKSSELYHWASFELVGQPTISWKGGKK